MLFNKPIKGRLVTERLSEHKLSPQLAAEIARKRVTELEEALNNTVEQVDVSRLTMGKLVEDFTRQSQDLVDRKERHPMTHQANLDYRGCCARAVQHAPALLISSTFPGRELAPITTLGYYWVRISQHQKSMSWTAEVKMLVYLG